MLHLLQGVEALSDKALPVFRHEDPVVLRTSFALDASTKLGAKYWRDSNLKPTTMRRRSEAEIEVIVREEDPQHYDVRSDSIGWHSLIVRSRCFAGHLHADHLMVYPKRDLPQTETMARFIAALP